MIKMENRNKLLRGMLNGSRRFHKVFEAVEEGQTYVICLMAQKFISVVEI